MNFGSRHSKLTVVTFGLVFICLLFEPLRAEEFSDTVGVAQSRIQAIIQAAFQDSTLTVKRPRLNWVDFGTSQANWLVMPGDDWGIKGVITAPGLPPTATTIYNNNLVEWDPLLGQIPLLWLNCRADSIATFPWLELQFWPRYNSNKGVQSRFDYYRGDYGFLNFTLYAAGEMAEGRKWRFIGENCAYDGYWGLLGANRSLQRESIGQSFRVDFSVLTGRQKNWQVALGAAYQKYMPGLLKVIPLGNALTWSHNGKLSEYRAQIYGHARRVSPDGVWELGGKVSNWIYGRFAQDHNYNFKGVALQNNYFGQRKWSGSRWDKAVRLELYTQSLQLRGQPAISDQLVTATLQFSQAADSQRLFKIGLQNKELHYDLCWNWSLTPSWQFTIRTTHAYFLYPQIYRLSMPRWQPIKLIGSGYDLHTLLVNYQSRYFNGRAGLQLARGKLYVPYRSSYADTLVTFRKYQPQYPSVYFNLQYTTPWHTILQFKATGMPPSGLGAWQFWGGLQQRLSLFNGNLQLLLGGELTYWGGAERWGWFDELRSIGQLDVAYFTNNRLNCNLRVDGNIGDLHLFYLINNVEGRSFSTLNGIPYRHMLRIFGVEWTFLN